jgi:hypothetical protein
MGERLKVNGNDINNAVNYNNPYSYEAIVSLASNTDIQTATITIDSKDFWASEVLVSVRDAAGKSLVSDDIVNDNILFNMQTEDGNDFVQNAGITLECLNKLINSNRFKGWVFMAKQKVSIKIWAETIPASIISTAPIKVHITFIGYRLG